MADADDDLQLVNFGCLDDLELAISWAKLVAYTQSRISSIHVVLRYPKSWNPQSSAFRF